jgi:outer membrane protein insertion porin family
MVVALSVFFCSFCDGQTTDFEGKRIIRAELSENPLDARDLESAQLLKAGDVYTRDAVAASIDRLFATGRFADIAVDAEPSADGVAVRYVVTPQWFVGHIGAEGKLKNPPNRGNIVNVSGINLADRFETEMVPRAERRIRALFERNGLYESTVETIVDREPRAQQVNLTFSVKAGKRARYETPTLQGEPMLSEGAILRATGWKRFLIGGYKKVTEQRTRNAVRGVLKKYQKQDRLTAKVEMRGVQYDKKTRRVHPTLYLEAGPKVKVKAIEAKVSKRNLRKYVPIYEEQRVDRDLLVEGARNLRDYFQRQGYYDADIDFRQRRVANDELLIEYVISRGERYKLVQVTVEGNKYFPTNTIRERMFLEPAGLLHFRHGRYSEAMRKKDIENIKNLYLANGFHDANVTSDVVRDFNGKKGDLAVNFHVNEGPQWFVAGLQLEGVENLDRQDLLNLLSQSEGQPFSETNIAADRAAILTRYYSNGFPDATFQYSTSPAAEPNRVLVRYLVTEGQEQFIRDVVINGFETTKPKMMERRITVKPGDPLSPIAVTDSQKNLYDTGVFAKVTTAVQNPEGTTQRKFTIFDINEANRYNLSLGFGADVARLGGTTTDLTTPAGSTGFSPRVSMDLTRVNLWGRGHYVSLRGRVSTLDQRASINYTAPRFNNVEGRNITFTALWQATRDVRTFSSRREEASVQVSQQFTKALTGLLRYTWRNVSVADVVIPTLLIPQLLQPVRIGMISADIAHDRRNDPADATRGIFTTADVAIASNVFGSQRSFVRGLARNSSYHRLTRKLLLARETSFGAILPFHVAPGLSNQESIPLPERFFGGGSTSHRGFPENQAGPRDIGVDANGKVVSQPTGFPLGGNALLFNMTELRFPAVGENITGVVFHDMGNIFTDVGSITFRARQRDLQDFNYMVHAVGAGIRYRTPIGPVRVDLSYSLNPPSFRGFQGTTQELLQCNPNLPISQLPGFCQSVVQSTGHFNFFFSIGQTF